MDALAYTYALGITGKGEGGKSSKGMTFSLSYGRGSSAYRLSGVERNLTLAGREGPRIDAKKVSCQGEEDSAGHRHRTGHSSPLIDCRRRFTS